MFAPPLHPMIAIGSAPEVIDRNFNFQVIQADFHIFF